MNTEERYTVVKIITLKNIRGTVTKEILASDFSLEYCNGYIDGLSQGFDTVRWNDNGFSLPGFFVDDSGFVIEYHIEEYE